MTTVLVTGGTGFLGSRIAARLAERGDQVRVMAHAQGSSPLPDDPRFEVVAGDIRDAGFVDRAAQGMEVVIHTASNFRRGGSDAREANAVNVGGTRNVLAACQKRQVRRLVHCSTIGVHGDVREIPANEETPFNPGDLYQSTKLEAEQAVWDFFCETGLPVTVIRPISMFGPGDRRMLKLFRMIQKRIFVMVGDGSVLFQPAYIDDVVSGFVLAMDHPAAPGQAFIIGGAEYVPLRQLVEMIARELGVSPPRWRVPVRPVVALAALTERVFTPLGLEPPLHRRRVSFYQNNRAFSVDKARRLLGYEPQVSLAEGIARTASWYRAHGWLSPGKTGARAEEGV